MESRLILIRHCHTSENGRSARRLCGRFDPPLSALGWEQLQRLRRRLSCEPASGAYSSPLQRAVATAQAVPETLSPVILNSLQEIDCGKFDGAPIKAIQESHGEIWQRHMAQDDDQFRWPGGETYRHFRTRALRIIRAIAGRHRGQRVLVVTHAGVISQVLGALTGENPARWGVFRAGNASVTEVAWNCTSGAVLRFDDRSHLAGLPES